jgi:predicted Fe-Mo cluster-binding NifX family protein
MRVVVSSDTDRGLDSSVSHHFGRCPFFSIVDVSDGGIEDVQVVDNPFFQSHAPGQVPAFIRKLNADAMIAGGMGRRAIDMFREYGIGCSTGAFGTVRSAVENFIEGGLRQAAPCRESIEHSRNASEYEKEDPAHRLAEEAAALLEKMDDVIVRLPDGDNEDREENR